MEFINNFSSLLLLLWMGIWNSAGGAVHTRAELSQNQHYPLLPSLNSDDGFNSCLIPPSVWRPCCWSCFGEMSHQAVGEAFTMAQLLYWPTVSTLLRRPVVLLENQIQLPQNPFVLEKCSSVVLLHISTEGNLQIIWVFVGFCELHSTCLVHYFLAYFSMKGGPWVCPPAFLSSGNAQENLWWLWDCSSPFIHQAGLHQAWIPAADSKMLCLWTSSLPDSCPAFSWRIAPVDSVWSWKRGSFTSLSFSTSSFLLFKQLLRFLL